MLFNQTETDFILEKYADGLGVKQIKRLHHQVFNRGQMKARHIREFLTELLTPKGKPKTYNPNWGGTRANAGRPNHKQIMLNDRPAKHYQDYLEAFKKSPDQTKKAQVAFIKSKQK